VSNTPTTHDIAATEDTLGYSLPVVTGRPATAGEIGPTTAAPIINDSVLRAELFAENARLRETLREIAKHAADPNMQAYALRTLDMIRGIAARACGDAPASHLPSRVTF
jgi:hypothetical protein